MWTVVYVSQESKTAEELVKVLRENGILSRVRRIGQSGSKQGFEVLVPQPEVNSAQEMIIDNELF